jgi:hypothetical protein
LAHCHNLWNLGEYEGHLAINNRLVVDLINTPDASSIPAFDHNKNKGLAILSILHLLKAILS